MHPRLQELVRYLEACRGDLLDAIEAVAPDRRGDEPEAGHWSVAQIVEHLGLVEARVARLLVKQTTDAVGLGDEASEQPILPTLNLDRIVARRGRVEASEATRPSENLNWSEACDALRRSRELLLSAMAEVDGLALGDVVSPHSALGVMNMYQWIGFVGAHELRHAKQIYHAAELLGGRPTATDRP